MGNSHFIWLGTYVFNLPLYCFWNPARVFDQIVFLILKNAMLPRIAKLVLVEFLNLVSRNLLKTFSVFNLLFGIRQGFLRALTGIFDFPFSRLIVKLFFKMLTKTIPLARWSFVSPPYLKLLLIFLHYVDAIRYIFVRLHFPNLLHCLLLPFGLCTFSEGKCLCH